MASAGMLSEQGPAVMLSGAGRCTRAMECGVLVCICEPLHGTDAQVGSHLGARLREAASSQAGC